MINPGATDANRCFAIYFITGKNFSLTGTLLLKFSVLTNIPRFVTTLYCDYVAKQIQLLNSLQILINSSSKTVSCLQCTQEDTYSKCP